MGGFYDYLILVYKTPSPRENFSQVQVNTTIRRSIFINFKSIISLKSHFFYNELDLSKKPKRSRTLFKRTRKCLLFFLKPEIMRNFNYLDFTVPKRICIYSSIFILFLFPLWTFTSEKNLVSATLVPEFQNLPPNRDLRLGVQFKIKKGWHIYWKNPGDSGLPTKIEWDLPKRWRIGPLNWPTPKRFLQKTVTNFGYENELFLYSQVNTPPNLKIGDKIPVKARVSWLACQEICIPGEMELSWLIRISSHGPQKTIHWNRNFSKTQSQLPQKIPHWNFKAHVGKENISMTIAPPNKKILKKLNPYFFPYEGEIIDPSSTQKIQFKENSLVLLMPKSEYFSKLPKKLSGVLSNKKGWGKNYPSPGVEIDLSLN